MATIWRWRSSAPVRLMAASVTSDSRFSIHPMMHYSRRNGPHRPVREIRISRHESRPRCAMRRHTAKKCPSPHRPFLMRRSLSRSCIQRAASKPGHFANRLWLIGAMTLSLSACYSDDHGYVVPPPTAYSIAGTITGLSAAGVVLQNEGGDSLAVSANSPSFRFETQVAAGGTYNVTVSVQPAGLTCTVSHGSGSNLAAPVTNVSVVCNPVSYTLAGTVTGLTADGLVLQNNGGDNLTVNANAATFQFSAPIAAGGGYSVAALAQPAGLTCTVSNGSGTNVRADVTNVSVTCSASTFTVGGTVTGLTASGLVVQDNGGGNLTVPTGASSFVFAPPVAYGSSYAATVFAQPAGQTCSVSNGTGTAKADVSGVTVACST